MKALRPLVIVLILLAACSCEASSQRNGVTEEFHQTYPISAGGSVKLNNVNGDVEINVWDKNEVKVDAVKRADDKDMMDQLQIVVNASSDLVDIDTKYPENSNTHNENGPSVEYTITVPVWANLSKIKTVNGDIEINGVNGKLNASTINGTIRAVNVTEDCELGTVNGKIDAEFTSLKSGSEVMLKSVNGSISVDLPSNLSARVKAKTVSGQIKNDFGLVSSHENDEDSFVKVGDSIDGKIGGGSASLDAETVNGGIRINKSAGSK